MSIKEKKIKYKIMLLISAIIGIITFLLIYPIKIIDVTYDGWLVNSAGDMAQHYLGWLYYRETPWQFPIGLLDGITYPYPFSVVYMDSIPIVALICKMLSPILPATFQYFGLYGLFTFVLQAIVSCKLLYDFTENSKASLIGCVYFLISSTMLQRMLGHSALAFHPIILLAILCYMEKEKIIEKKRDILYWTLLLALACSVHAYFVPMVFAFIAAFYLPEIISKKWYIGCIKTSIPIVITILVMYIWGYFYGERSFVDSGYGVYNSNINVLFNDLGTSFFDSLMGEVRSEGIGEAYAYLGAGVFILSTVVLYDLMFQKKTFPLKKQYIPTIILVFVFVVVSVLPIIRIGNYTIFEFSFPQKMVQVLSIFRANGRFMWPVTYFILFGGVVYVILNYRKKGCWLLFICLLIQILDLSKLCNIHHNRIKTFTELPYRLESDAWNRLKKNEIFFFYNPVGGGEIDITCSLGKYACDNHMVMNDFYVSRKDNKKINQDRRTEYSEILEGNPDNLKLYIFNEIPIEFLTYETGLFFYKIDGILIGITDKLKDQNEISIEQGIHFINDSGSTITIGKKDANGAHIERGGAFSTRYSRLPSGIYHIEYYGDNFDNAIFRVLVNDGAEEICLENMQESDEKVMFDIILNTTCSNVILNCENTGVGELLLTDAILLSEKSKKEPNELSIGETVSFMKSSYNAEMFIQQGMSQPEELFTWTEGNETQFSFLLNTASTMVHGMIEVAGVFNGEQEVVIFVNETEVFSGILRGEQNIEFDFMKPEDKVVDIVLKLPNAISPFEVSESGDIRELALGIRSIIFMDP